VPAAKVMTNGDVTAGTDGAAEGLGSGAVLPGATLGSGAMLGSADGIGSVEGVGSVEGAPLAEGSGLGSAARTGSGATAKKSIDSDMRSDMTRSQKAPRTGVGRSMGTNESLRFGCLPAGHMPTDFPP
jgi:hypothetical protein